MEIVNFPFSSDSIQHNEQEEDMEIVNSPFSSDNEIPREEVREPSPVIEIPVISLPSVVPETLPVPPVPRGKHLKKALREESLALVISKWKEYLHSIPEEDRQSSTYDLFMSAPKKFLIEAHDILIKKNKKYQNVKGCNVARILHRYWIKRISQFNSLVWENLFGITLNKGARPSLESKQRVISVNNIPKYRQHGAQFIGVMRSSEKIQKWINLTGKTKLKKCRDDLWQSLLNKGSKSLEKKPPAVWKSPTEVPDDLFSSKEVLLSFEARVLSRHHPRVSKTTGPITVLQFTNVVCSESVDYSQFLKIVQMYVDVWRVYCYSKLRGHTKTYVSCNKTKTKD